MLLRSMSPMVVDPGGERRLAPKWDDPGVATDLKQSKEIKTPLITPISFVLALPVGCEQEGVGGRAPRLLSGRGSRHGAVHVLLQQLRPPEARQRRLRGRGLLNGDGAVQFVRRDQAALLEGPCNDEMLIIPWLFLCQATCFIEFEQ